MKFLYLRDYDRNAAFVQGGTEASFSLRTVLTAMYAGIVLLFFLPPDWSVIALLGAALFLCVARTSYPLRFGTALGMLLLFLRLVSRHFPDRQLLHGTHVSGWLVLILFAIFLFLIGDGCASCLGALIAATLMTWLPLALAVFLYNGMGMVALVLTVLELIFLFTQNRLWRIPLLTPIADAAERLMAFPKDGRH